MCINIDCCALIALDSYIELRVFSGRKLVSGSHIIVNGLLLLKCKNNEKQSNFDYVKRPTVSLKYSWAFVHWSPNLL